jgi:hypothetical protein
MKKHLLLFLTAILSLNCYSQISFEKGYYIDNDNQKINCLIKNIDWKSNPTQFEYKLSEDSDSNTLTIKTIKEFSVFSISKYVRNTVNIDRSSTNVTNLSYNRKPIFSEETLFLKVIVEGQSNLYEYKDINLKRYFYTNENSNIEQLIFKKYKTINEEIGRNNRFRQQLWTGLKCPNFKMSKIENLDYNKNDLAQFFNEYSKCYNKDIISFEPKQKRDLFNLTIRPRLNSSSLSIQNSFITDGRNADFDNKIGFGFGLEAEFILPFNKNKWAITIEPTYQSFKSEKKTNNINHTGGRLIAKADYSSIEIPVSLRHYLFLNNNSKIFINASFIFDLSSKSSIEFSRDNASGSSSIEIVTRPNFAFGIGYKYNDKYSLEVRHLSSREVLDSYLAWNSDYKTFSLIFGYSIF